MDTSNNNRRGPLSPLTNAAPTRTSSSSQPNKRARRQQQQQQQQPPPPPTRIPTPDSSIFEMKAATTDPILREAHHKVSRESYQELEERGYVPNLRGEYFWDFKKVVQVSEDDFTCGKFKVLYAVFDKATKHLIKIGYTGDLEFRKTFYDDREDYIFVPFMKLRHLQPGTDAFLQTKYRELMEVFKTHTEKPVRVLGEMITERGGEEFGVKGNSIDKILEAGGQLRYGLPVPGELTMYDAAKHKRRVEIVMSTASAVSTVIQSHLDPTKKIHIDSTSSWRTAYYKPRTDNDEGKFVTTSTLLEYITGNRIDDMADHDTIPVPAVPGAKTASEAFSDNYSKPIINQGQERFHNFVRGMQDNTFMLLDACKVLGMDIPAVLEDEYLYREILDVWDGEGTIFAHEKHNKVIDHHQPLGHATDSRSEVPTANSVKRMMLAEAMKLVVHELLSDNEKESFDSYADGIIACYVFEWLRNAAGMDKRVSAAGARDAITPSSDMALHQKVSGRTVSDPHYPICEYLRKLFNNVATKDTVRPQDCFAVTFATNILTFVEDASNGSEIEDYIKKVDGILKADGQDFDGTRMHPFYDTHRYRWKAVLDNIMPTSPLRVALDTARNATKKNKGNKGAHGLKTQEKEDYEADFLCITELLPLQTPIWVRATDATDADDALALLSAANGHPVFDTFTEGGLKGRVSNKRITKNNTNATKASRPTIPLKLNRVLGKDGHTQYIGEGNKFMLVQVMEGVENQEQLMEQQMQAIENTAVGGMFWVRVNSKSSPTIPPPSDQVSQGHPVYNVPLHISVRDRLAKNKTVHHKSINKVGGSRPVKTECKRWVLCMIVRAV